MQTLWMRTSRWSTRSYSRSLKHGGCKSGLRSFITHSEVQTITAAVKTKVDILPNVPVLVELVQDKLNDAVQDSSNAAKEVIRTPLS